MPNAAPIFATLIAVILVARFFGFIFRKMGQPPVMGEVLGGIILGPSALGYLFPSVSTYFFHADALSFLKHVAELGISLYLFLMGLEIDLPRLQKAARSAAMVSILSILLPFGLGLLLAHHIYAEYAPPNFGFPAFALFIGVSMSITAFPVLARILSDSPLHKTKLGDLALSCAALDDITAWCLVAVVTGVMSASIDSAWLTLGLTIAYMIFMIGFVRPFFRQTIPKLEKRFERLPEALLALAILGALTSATITDLIGIHGLFGAFLFGAVVPHDSLVARDINGRLQDFVRILFLPAFFALTGLKTQLGLLANSQEWLLCAVIIALAIIGKFGGAFTGSMLAGNTRHESTVLGILMNTRGLVELIVLNIGYSLGILSPTLFTMLVVMAVVTTFMTGPLLHLVGVERYKA